VDKVLSLPVISALPAEARRADLAHAPRAFVGVGGIGMSGIAELVATSDEVTART
jgi:hypothetical protein